MDDGAQSSTTRSILHIISPAPVGGLETVVRRLARGHATRGHDVGVISIGPAVGRLPAFFRNGRESPVQTYPIEIGARAYLTALARVERVLDRFQPELVHTHGYRTDVLESRVARRREIPRVSTVHGFTGGDLKNRVYEWLQRRALRRFDAVVAVARPLRDQLHASGISEDRLFLVPNAGAPIARPLARPKARKALGLPEEAFVVGWVGRLNPPKGPDILLRAIDEIDDPGARVMFVGPEEDERYRQLARDLGIDDRIRWAGVVPDASRYFQAFDALVLSSRTEGTPMVLLEAMSAGVPVVATRVGGIPDVVSEHEAVLVPPEDPEALAQGIRRVRDDRSGASDRADRARARVESEYSMERWLDRYESVYASVLRGD